MRHRLPIAALAVAALLPATAAHADTTLAQTLNDTSVSAGGGTVLYDSYDKTTKAYTLMALSGTPLTAAPVPVPSSPQGFSADVGTGAQGQPVYAYLRCATAKRGSCDVATFDPATGVETPLPASKAGVDEENPTVDGGRVVFSRTVTRGKDNVGQVFLAASPTARKATSLPGLPTKVCLKRTCTAAGSVIEGLELHGSTLAETGAGEEPFEVERGKLQTIGTTDLRLVNTKTKKVTELSSRGSGESGQTWIAPNFDGSALYADFACYGDESGCGAKNSGAYRYDLKTRTWSHAAIGNTLAGFAISGGTTYVEQAPPGGDCTDVADFGGDGTCHLDELDPAPSYAPVKKP